MSQQEQQAPTIVPVEDGKYTIVVDQGSVRIDRHGQPWLSGPDVTAPKMLIAAAFELEALRERVAELEASGTT